MYKTLSYISKINKNKKAMNKLSKEMMKNLKFYFIEEESNIKYEEYYFNGLSIPKNIEFKDISYDSLNISWNIDYYNKDNKIKFQVEMRKENEEEKFKIVYEGIQNNCSINNLLPDTNYEFRIHLLNGDWSEIKKVKTLIKIDSKILKKSKKEIELIYTILEWINPKRLELIYRGTRDGTKPENFHNLCDNKGPTVTLFKNEKGNIFGGYASISWTSNGGYKSAPDSFIFTLTNIHNTKPTKFPSKNDNNEVYHDFSYGPYFGGGRDFGIGGDFANNNFYTNFPYTYPDILRKGRSIFTGDINNDNKYFKVLEIEVFKIQK